MIRFARRTLVAALAGLLPFVAAHAQVQERTLKFTYQNAKGHPQDQGGIKFAELVAAKSGGKIKVTTFPGGVLGGDLQTVSALQGGTVEMTVLNAGILGAQVREMAVFDLPFLFNGPQEADAVTDGPFGKKLLAKLADKGVVGKKFWDKLSADEISVLDVETVWARTSTCGGCAPRWMSRSASAVATC